LTNATISGSSTFSGVALIGSTYSVATNAGVQFLDSNGDPKLAIVDGRIAFSDNWPVIADATDAFSPRYSVAVSNTAPSAGAILNRGTADYRYGIPTTFSKTGLVQAASAATDPVTLTYREYLSTDLAAPANDPPMELTLSNVKANVFRVSATATFGDYVNKRFPTQTYDADRFPGLIQ
jgi:hypothetical protein